MNKITVFDTYEQAASTLERYLDENEKIRDKISEIGIKKEKKYRDSIGYDEKIRKLQEKPRTSHHQPLIPLDPSSIGLPKEEREKLWSDVGNGLELICFTDLRFDNGSYYFDYGIIESSHLPEFIPYATISNLVDGIKESMKDEYPNYHGAALNPFVYTVIEHPQISKEQVEILEKNTLDALVEWAMELNKSNKQKIYLRPTSLDIPAPRALNEEERTEFERLFYKME